MHYPFTKTFSFALFMSAFFVLLHLSSSLAMANETFPGNITVGVASWYGGIFEERLTANGEIFHEHSFSAAHKTLPLGTVILVENLINGKQVIVRINDRGPYAKERIIDLSVRAARNLDMIKTGVTRIAFTVIGDAQSRPLNPAYAFFIRLAETNSFISMQSSLPMIATTVSRPIYTLFSPPPQKLFNICIGPFASFIEAHEFMTKIEHHYSVLDIVLAPKKGGPLPFISLHSTKRKDH